MFRLNAGLRTSISEAISRGAQIRESAIDDARRIISSADISHRIDVEIHPRGAGATSLREETGLIDRLKESGLARISSLFPAVLALHVSDDRETSSPGT